MRLNEYACKHMMLGLAKAISICAAGNGLAPEYVFPTTSGTQADWRTAEQPPQPSQGHLE